MEKEVRDTWEENAREWIDVVSSGQIASRRFTDVAIQDMLKSLSGPKVLDVGCGEGWLTRRLSKMGKRATGVDAIETLLAYARSRGPEPYQCLSYADIIAGNAIINAPFDTAVFNFSLYRKDDVDILFKIIKGQLTDQGYIVVQTLHPYFLIQNGLEYKSQMIRDSWKGLPGNFTGGHSWYARTLGDWVKLVTSADLKIVDIKETLNAENKPISLILAIS